MSTDSAPARYNDGRTAAARTVSVHRYGAELAIHGEDGAPIEVWPVSEIRMIEAPDKSGRIVLSRQGQGSRLRIDDPEFVTGVRAWAPYLRRDPYGKSVSTRLVVLSFVGAVASVVILIRFLLPLFAAE